VAKRLCHLLVSCCLGMCFLANLGAVSTAPGQSVAEKYVGEAAARLKARLDDEGLWADETRKEELAQCLEEAIAVKSKTLVPVLVKHVGYLPFYKPSDAEDLQMKPDSVYPVARVLSSIGLSSVQAILENMKAVDLTPKAKPVDPGQLRQYLASTQEQQRRSVGLILALKRIYDVGGHGAEMARQRLQLEIGGATGQAKENLSRFKEHPILNTSEGGGGSSKVEAQG
jgi:hypothetical protein